MNRRTLFKTIAGMAAIAPARGESINPLELTTQRIADMAVEIVWEHKPKNLEFAPAHRYPAMPHDVVNTPTTAAGNVKTEFEKHYEATAMIPANVSDDLLKMYLTAACIAIAECLPKDGVCMCSELHNRALGQPPNGAISKHGNRGGLVVRATLTVSDDWLLTIDVLYGRFGGERRMIIVNAMDAESFMQHADKIADALSNALERGHPVSSVIRHI